MVKRCASGISDQLRLRHEAEGFLQTIPVKAKQIAAIIISLPDRLSEKLGLGLIGLAPL
jgi:hypothetical protein